MEAEGRTVPKLVRQLLAAGNESFYSRNADGVREVFDIRTDEKAAARKGSWLGSCDLACPRPWW